METALSIQSNVEIKRPNDIDIKQTNIEVGKNSFFNFSYEKIISISIKIKTKDPIAMKEITKII